MSRFQPCTDATVRLYLRRQPRQNLQQNRKKGKVSWLAIRRLSKALQSMRSIRSVVAYGSDRGEDILIGNWWNAINLPHRPTFTPNEGRSHQQLGGCAQVEGANMSFVIIHHFDDQRTPYQSSQKAGSVCRRYHRLEIGSGKGRNKFVLKVLEKDYLRVRGRKP